MDRNEIVIKETDIFVRKWAQSEIVNLVCPELEEKQAYDTCKEAFFDEAFHECRRTISPEKYIQYCTDGMCKNDGGGYGCAAIELYAKHCIDQEVQIGKWRPTLCPTTCDENFVWNENTPNCDNTCLGKILGDCTQSSAGCTCPVGYVIQERV